ncbi:hypothetical protein DOY81_015321, partial [Sarcophaga bullata]
MRIPRDLERFMVYGIMQCADSFLYIHTFLPVRFAMAVWATEQKTSKREHFGLITHIIFTLIYVVLHSFLIMFQATTLNVAVNSSNKGLLTIMISNNFVELKGS